MKIGGSDLDPLDISHINRRPLVSRVSESASADGDNYAEIRDYERSYPSTLRASLLLRTHSRPRRGSMAGGYVARSRHGSSLMH